MRKLHKKKSLSFSEEDFSILYDLLWGLSVLPESFREELRERFYGRDNKATGLPILNSCPVRKARPRRSKQYVVDSKLDRSLYRAELVSTSD